MGIRMTDNENVALYDSSTGRAFGPIFDNADAADDFLEWYDASEFTTDLRRLNYEAIELLLSRWLADRAQTLVGTEVLVRPPLRSVVDGWH